MPGHDTLMVLGASGQIGRFVLARARRLRAEVVAVSRRPRAGDDLGARWLVGDLTGGMPAVAAASLISTGPLDACVAWLRASPPAGLARVVAFSSTSAETKLRSTDATERAVALRLVEAEDALTAWCARHSVACTLLRPTLVYGTAHDRTIARIAALASRLGFAVLPRGARGLRQPVHADDLAQAAVAALAHQAAACRRYDLPGGETLAYDAMVARVLAVQAKRLALFRVPDALFAAAAGIARGLGLLDGLTPAVIARMRDDLVFDDGPARADLGYAPRAFRLDAESASHDSRADP